MNINSTLKIKICGLKLVSEVLCAANYGVNWYGMIFVPNTPRYISINKAKLLITKTPPTLTPVAVTVDAKIEYIKDLIALGIKDFQLHGNESINFCKDIKKKYKVNIIKAVKLSNAEDLNIAEKYSSIVDWILFDYKDEVSFGGLGKTFDWNILSNQKLKFNWILSGGLHYTNIVKAINVTGAKALDVSSGVEKKRGVKSIKLMQKFCNTVNNFYIF